MFKGSLCNLPSVAPLGAGWEGVEANYTYNSLVMIQLKSSALPAPSPSLLTTGIAVGMKDSGGMTNFFFFLHFTFN